VGEEDIKEPEMELKGGLDLQAGRIEKIGMQTYGVPIDIVQHLSTRSMDFFQPLSERWHLFLGVASTRRQEDAKTANKRTFTDTQDIMQTESHKRPRVKDNRQALS
jgi:hypothetical protein